MNRLFSLAAIFCLSLFFSCTDVERDNPYDPGGNNYIGDGWLLSSSSVERSSSSSVERSSSSAAVTVSCDINSYRTTVIGTQIWMAENLNCNATNSKCYNNDNTNCNKYGRLYNWATAMTVCNNGWRLPSRAEWDILVEAVGGPAVAGLHLKATSGWGSNGNGADTYGFTALPGANCGSTMDCSGIGNFGLWWSSTENTTSNAWDLTMGFNGNGTNWNNGNKSVFRSVRCVKD